jgi:hypothetical protein
MRGPDGLFLPALSVPTIERSLFLMGMAPVPLPQKRNAPFIPMSEAPGLSGAEFGKRAGESRFAENVVCEAKRTWKIELNLE